MSDQKILKRIYEVILDRKKRRPPASYTASLYQKGEDAILKKIGEEAWEVMLASKTGKEDEIIHEVADLYFHLLVMLGLHEIPPERVFGELEKRFGVPGKREHS